MAADLARPQVDPIGDAATAILDGFRDYRARFGEITRAAKSRFEHYGFMNVHVTGQLPGGKKVEANPSYNGETGTMIWR